MSVPKAAQAAQAAQAVPDWKANFSDKNSTFDNAGLIKKWYAEADNPINNPNQLIELNDRTRQMIGYFRTQIGKIDIPSMIRIVDGLKAFYKKISEKRQKSDLVFIDLMVITEEQITDVVKPPNYTLTYKVDIEKDFTKFMPQFSEHFKAEHLNKLDFGKLLKKEFLEEFKKVVTLDELENLDKESINEQEKGGNVFKFNYESHIEYLYIQIIIKMLEYKDLPDLTPISEWLQNYPFRMLNKDGHTTPDNFYLSADKYINDKTTPSGAKPSKADLVKRYKAFFLKLKTVRVIPGKTIEDATEFLDLYDEAPLTEKPDIPMRSMNFREDFDYLNSLNIKGVNLNRAFWLLLDNELDNRRIGPYTKAVTKSSNLDEFLQTVTSELSLKSNVFIDKLKYEVYKLQYLCSKLPQELEDERKRLEAKESRDAVMKHVPDNTPLNMSNEEYGILYDKGAKPISDYINKIDGNKLEMLGSRSNQVKKLKEGAETKKIQLVNAADIRSEGESDEPELYKLIDIDISMDVSEQVYKNKMYISTFNPRFGFQEKLMRLFLQLEKPQEPEEDVIMSSGQDSIIDFTDTDEKNLLGDLEDLSRQLTQLNSQKGGGKPPVRHFHSVDFVKISLMETSSITFDINKMTKKDIYNFIKKMVDEDRVTYYKIQYSVGNKDVPTEFKQFPKDDHDAIMQSIARKEAILKSNMAQLNAGLEQKRKAIEDKIKAMREAENKKIAEGAELDKQREEAITKIKLRLDEERDEMNIELEKKLAEAQAELDAAKDREEAKKAELEAATADAAAAKKKSQEEIEAEVAANQEKIEKKEALQKSNAKILAGLKSKITRLKATISAEIIAPIELEIIEAKARKLKLEMLYKDSPNKPRMDAVTAAIEKMEKIKAFVEAAVEANVGETDEETRAAAIKLKPDESWAEAEWSLLTPLKRTYEEALAKYNEPIPWKTFNPDSLDFDNHDTTPFRLKAASTRLGERYDEIKAAKSKYLDKLKGDAIKGVTEYTADEKSKMSPPTAKPVKKVKIQCKSPGFEENKEGWCYKKADGIKEEEPVAAIEASKVEPVEEPPRRSGRASKPKKQFGE